jgi:uncharacterized protein YdaU (DUF1376 family)
MSAGDGFPWFKQFASDWLHATRFLTAEQTGWLARLECECWLSETRGAISSDPEMLWKLAGAETSERFAAEGKRVLGFFTEDDGRLQSKRLWPQAVQAEQRSAERSSAGKRGAEVTKQRYFAPSGGNGHGRTEQNKNKNRTDPARTGVDANAGKHQKQNLSPITDEQYTPAPRDLESLKAHPNPWEQIRTEAARALTPVRKESFDTCMKPCRFAGVDCSTLMLAVPNEGLKQMCERFQEEIMAAIKELEIPLSGVRFIVRGCDAGA